MRDTKESKATNPGEGDEELTEKEKAMYMILFGKDWDEDYPPKGKNKG